MQMRLANAPCCLGAATLNHNCPIIEHHGSISF
jgi:hypothetical protein